MMLQIIFVFVGAWALNKIGDLKVGEGILFHTFLIQIRGYIALFAIIISPMLFIFGISISCDSACGDNLRMDKFIINDDWRTIQCKCETKPIEDKWGELTSYGGTFVKEANATLFNLEVKSE